MGSPPLLPQSKLFSIFGSSPSFWVLPAPRSYGAASPVPIQPGAGPFPAWELLWEETAGAGAHPRAAPHPAPGEGRAPLPAGSPPLPGVLC